MLHITSLDDGIEIFKALGSDVRIQILNILLENSNMSLAGLFAGADVLFHGAHDVGLAATPLV